MSPSLRSTLWALAALAVLPVSLRAQTSPLQDVVPERLIRKPTRAELDRLEALTLYGKATELELENRLPEALRTLEKAARLDPASAAVPRALLPLYLALDRQQDALDCCRRVLELDPDDYDTRYVLARQLRMLGRDREAIKALSRALKARGLKDRPEARLSIAYDLGLLHEKANAYTEAEAAFRQAAEVLKHPAQLLDRGLGGGQDIASQAAEIHERIGRLCLKAGQTDQAIEAFKLAQKSDPAHAIRLSLNLAQVLASQRKHAEALRYLDEYLSQQPHGTEGYELKIRILRETGRGNEVIPALEKYSQADRHNRTLRLLLAHECRKAGRLAEAEKFYLMLLMPPRSDVYKGLLGVYRAEGERGANRLLERLNRSVSAARPDDEKKEADPLEAAHARALLAALREDPAAVKALLLAAHQRILNNSPLSFQTRVLIGLLAERANQLDTAERLFRSCLDAEGKVAAFGIRRQSEHEVYGGLLQTLARARKHREVLDVCKKGLAHAEATNRMLFHEHMAFAYLGLDRMEEALKEISTAVDLSPDRTRLGYRCKRASLLAQMERYQEAETECLALLKEARDPGDVQRVRFTLSAIYSLAKEQDRSEEQLQAILKDDPANAHACNDLGYQWADRNKNLEEAERLIRKALELDQQQRNSNDALGIDSDLENAAYVDSLGWVLFRRGRLQEARKQLGKAASLTDGTDDPVVWDHLGDVYCRLKKDQKAAECWRKALKLYDTGHRRKTDGRYKDIEEKLKLLTE
jgi:tetratricopeptide (TPR) repeat protein